MGKKAAAAPAAQVEEVPPEVKEPPAEQLQGEFVFPDGSTYNGQYLKKGDAIFLHGEGVLKTGPETFQGTFENGSYKVGRYTSCTGAVYSGTFKENRFHGAGEYTWPDGRVYRGTWQNGQMNGKGEFLNFSIGANRAFAGFCVRGRFSSGTQEQSEARRSFLVEYRADCVASVGAALRDMAQRATAGDGVPMEYIVPCIPQQNSEGEEKPDAADAEAIAAALEEVQQVVSGPFPSAAALQAAPLQAFAARLHCPGDKEGLVEKAPEKETKEKEKGKKGDINANHASQVPLAVLLAGALDVGDGDGAHNEKREQTEHEERKDATASGEGTSALNAAPTTSRTALVSGRFPLQRLLLPQLQYTGQAVEFFAGEAEPAGISSLVFVNVSSEHDLQKAAWKLVHCEMAE